MLGVLRRVFDFSSWQSSHPSDPPPGDMLDASFDAQNSKISELEAHLLGVVRSDGNVQNGIVSWDALDPALILRLKTEILRDTQIFRSEAEISAQNAVAARQVAEKSAEIASEGAGTANLAKILTEDARTDAITQIRSLISETGAVLGRLQSAEASLLEARTDWDDAEGVAQAWSYASQEWAEHMPGTLPASTVAMMHLTGDHWSSRWWANQAANAFGMLTSLYLGVHPSPPTTNNNGGPIEIGSIYYDSTTGQAYIWTGSQWESFYGVQRAGMATLWYSGADGQTVFPLSVADLHGNTFVLSENPEGIDPHVNGIKLMPLAAGSPEGDFTVSSGTSTVTLLRPVRAGDIVSFDILMPVESLGPGNVISWKIKALTGINGTTTVFSLETADAAGPSVTVQRNEELLVSVDGVLQEPTVSYSAAGATITFVSAPSADSYVFITWFQSTGSAGLLTTTDWADITGKPATFPPTLPIPWADVSGKPSTFAPSSHSHPQSEVTNLVTDLGLKAPLASPALTGTPTAALPAVGDDSTRIATTEWYRDQYLQNSVVYDPASLATGVVDTIQTLTVTGAAVGDYCLATFSVDLLGVTLLAWVSGTNTTKFQFQNKTAGTQNLASGTVRVRVWKQ